MAIDLGYTFIESLFLFLNFPNKFFLISCHNKTLLKWKVERSLKNIIFQVYNLWSSLVCIVGISHNLFCNVVANRF